jgi:hypothetical protein
MALPCGKLLVPAVAVDGLGHFRVEQAFGIKLVQVGDVALVLLADGSGEVALVCIVPS